jgi:hypothetical protein
VLKTLPAYKILQQPTSLASESPSWNLSFPRLAVLGFRISAIDRLAQGAL